MPTAMPTATAAPTSLPDALKAAGYAYSACYTGPDYSIKIREDCRVPIKVLNPGGFNIERSHLNVQLVNPKATVPGTNIIAEQYDVTANYDAKTGTGTTETAVYLIPETEDQPVSFALEEGTQMADRVPTALEKTVEKCAAEAKAGNAKLATVNIPQGGSLDWLTGRGNVSDCYLHGGQEGTSLYNSLEEAVFNHMSGQGSKVVVRGADGNPLGPDQIQPGTAKLFMKGDAPVIRGTYMPELTPADVGLPWDPTYLGTIHYKKCYVYDEVVKLSHGGDMIYFDNLQRGEELGIIAPLAGKVEYIHFINPHAGYFVAISTGFSHKGKPLYYAIAHLENISVTEGQSVEKGDTLGHVVGYGAAQDNFGRGSIDFGWITTTGEIRTIDSQNPDHVRDNYIPGYTIWASLFQNILQLKPEGDPGLADSCRGNPFPAIP